MPDSSAESILQAARAWIMASASVTAALTDAQVIVANDKGPRPPLPYLSVDVTLVDEVEGLDEPRQSMADVLTVVDVGADADTFTVSLDDDVVVYTRGPDDDGPAIAAALALAIRTARTDVSAIAVDAVIAVVGMWAAVTVATSDPKIDQGDPIAVAGVSGDRSGTLSVQGYGRGADGWLERSAIALRLPAIDDALAAAGLSVIAIGGMRDLSQLLDTSIEPRWLREYRVTYQIRIDPAAYDTALSASIAITVADPERTATITVDLET